MGLEDNLHRCESTLCAIASGNLAPGNWACDHIGALGMSGQRNPLGSAILHLMDHPNLANRGLVVFYLSGILVRQAICLGRDSVDLAGDAITWWENKHCPNCHGNGVMDFQQTTCPVCAGNQDKPMPSYKPLADAIGVINQALQRLEGQLRAQLGNTPDRAPEPEYVISSRTHPHDHPSSIPPRGAVTPKARDS